MCHLYSNHALSDFFFAMLKLFFIFEDSILYICFKTLVNCSVMTSVNLPLTFSEDCGEAGTLSRLYGSLSFHRSMHQSFPKIPSMVGDTDTEEKSDNKGESHQ